MPLTVHLLGSGASYNTGRRLTTALAIEVGDDVIVVDCGSNTGQALARAGITLERVRALVITHEHIDHVGGFPLFVQQLWLAGRTQPLPICGPETALERIRAVFAQYPTDNWDGMFDLTYHQVPLAAGSRIAVPLNVTITAAPIQHSVPGIGLRVVDVDNHVLAYSADTEPAPAIVELARDADLLIHEATGDYTGHSSGADAGRVASEAEAGTLVLVHLAGDAADAERVADAARKQFGGTVFAGEDGAHYRVT